MDPLAPLAITAATHAIKPLSSGVSRVGDFASVLASQLSDGAETQAKEVGPPTVEQTEALRREASEVIDQLLRGSDIAANQPLRIRVQLDGELRLADDHPRAAEIEALLNGDASLRSLTSQLISRENAEIQLDWRPDNLTETGAASYIMGNQRLFGG